MNAGSTRERHLGIVTNVDDDEKRGRIKVASASLMGVDDQGVAREYPVWLEPSFPHLMVSGDDEGKVDSGFFFVPSVGTTVEFEITASGPADKSYGQSSIGNPDPRWISTLFLPGDSVSEDFLGNYPNRMGWRSKKGSLLMFDDTDGAERALLRGPANSDGIHSYFAIEPNGGIIIATHAGHLFNLQASGGIVLMDPNGNTISSSNKGLSLLTDLGAFVTIGKDVQIVSGGNVTVTGNNVKLNAANVELGKLAIEAVIKGNTFQALFNSHTHQFVGNIGVPGITLPPLIPLSGAELSTAVKTQ